MRGVSPSPGQQSRLPLHLIRHANVPLERLGGRALRLRLSEHDRHAILNSLSAVP